MKEATQKKQASAAESRTERSGGTEAAAEDTTKRTFIRAILDAKHADQGKRWNTLFPAIVQSVRALNGTTNDAKIDIAAVDAVAQNTGATQDFAFIRERFQDYLKYNV
jgi:hypothetical protein